MLLQRFARGLGGLRSLDRLRQSKDGRSSRHGRGASESGHVGSILLFSHDHAYLLIYNINRQFEDLFKSLDVEMLTGYRRLVRRLIHCLFCCWFNFFPLAIFPFLLTSTHKGHEYRFDLEPISITIWHIFVSGAVCQLYASGMPAGNFSSPFLLCYILKDE